jgi:hypothetical protein
VAIVPAVLVTLHYVLLDFTGRIGLLGLGCTAWFFYAGWKFFLSTLKAAFFETGDSPKVRAVFVDGTLPDEAEEGLEEGTGTRGLSDDTDTDSDEPRRSNPATGPDHNDSASGDTQGKDQPQPADGGPAAQSPDERAAPGAG